ncbi:VOC family protein [Nakamurella deserti]|uniref:VOC family protein n=1 Tax=Nakamurella deserti TaxID=2164074 RepID=UPI000DBE39DC|nr:VOC family protein [Nakamurella deserti]
MTPPIPYLTLPGTAREALTFYRDVFGGELTLHTFADFARDDGPPDAIAHGILHGPVALFAADAAAGEATVRIEGVLFSLLGTADPETLTTWFEALSDGGSDVDPLQRRPWGASDGQVTDRFGVRWLIGYED